MMQIMNTIEDYTDNRGAITHLLDDGHTCVKSVLWITSKAGAVRANHYHKTDWHYCYLVSGRMEYFERPIDGDASDMKSRILGPGEIVFTPPMMAHAMRFLEDSVFLVLARNSRHEAAYEADTVRIKLIE